MHSSARRRKKRLNYGVRTVEVERGPNGFGFTISGQQPCILSCIVANSPADISGLRAGDFLISVNGVNVSKLAHDAVVGLIGNCFGPIQMTIAENYYSDSSDEDVDFGRIVNVRKQKHNNKLKPNKVKQACRSYDRCHLEVAHSSTSNNDNKYYGLPNISYEMLKENQGPLEYKVIVGYLGTIEMPKQLLPNARFDTVTNCIRKLRQEKRAPTSVLMTVLPTCLTLKNTSNHILAIYPVNRVIYVNSLAEKDCRYFGLVTSAVSDAETSEDINEFTISNSCHVFTTDSKLVEHEIHAKKAESFKITCTIDVVTGSCLEFPKSAGYIVKLIQNLYRLEDTESDVKNNEDFVANSPQPSASSNSDSGIGYRDECGNISDRILVVEFPSKSLPILPTVNKRPANVTASNITPENLDDDTLFQNYNIESIYGEKQTPNINNIRACESVEKISNRLTVRVMPTKNEFSERPVDVPETISVHSLDFDFRSSVDNISVHSTKSADLKPTFKTPKYFEYKKARKLKPVTSCDNLTSDRYEEKVLNYKLSPKVYGMSKPTQSCEQLNARDVERVNFGSLQDLSLWCLRSGVAPNVTQSCPDVRVEKQEKNKRDDSELNSEGPSAWLTSFEKLVECPVGLHAFAEFLKKEFSAENIYFWTACERFRLMPDGPERKAEAERIFSRHLRIGCTDAVNVDSKARQFAEQTLSVADDTTFHLAQKQIFNLMKFDSYPRFIKSDIYKHILNGNGTCPELDTRLLVVNPVVCATPTKLKKSLSNAEDRRRKSLLPWHKKNRSRSKDRGENDLNSELENNNGKLSDVNGSKNSLDFQNQDGTLTRQNLCRVNLHSDYSGGTTIAQVRDAETIQQMVDRLLEKRGLTFFTYDITTDKCSKPLDITSSAQQLIGCQVFVERKVTFKLDLPNRKIISVKSKHSKIISEVLRHILQRYNYSLPDVNVSVDGTLVNVDLPVTSIENKRLLVSMKETVPKIRLESCSTKSLDEITNRVYKDILQGKSEASCSVKSKSDRSSVKSEDLGSEHSSIFGRFLRRDSGIIDRRKKFLSRSKGPSTNSSAEELTCGEGGSSNLPKKPLIAKWVSGTKLHVAHSEREELYEGLSRMQRSRLEDQRGTEINFELPDFLKDKENSKKVNAKKRSTDDRERSKFYTRPSIQEYENHVITSKDCSSDTSTTEDTCSSNKSTPSKSLEVTVIEASDSSRIVRNMEPPPLPPKPKIVPIKPSNWGQNDYVKKDTAPRPAERGEDLFLEQPTSSFV